MARTHARIDPKRIECGPAAFVAVMPPIVQNAPLDGSTGNRKPCLRAAASTSARNAPGPALTVRDATSTPAMSRHRLRSTMIPSPIAPPGMLLPEPRAISGSARSFAQRVRRERSSTSRGTATAIGTLRAMPAASA